jgi:hypothetical protein
MIVDDKSANGGKSWRKPVITDVGSVDEQTMGNDGKLIDSLAGDRWKVETAESARIILPDGE